jgi:hypothetical protein
MRRRMRWSWWPGRLEGALRPLLARSRSQLRGGGRRLLGRSVCLKLIGAGTGLGGGEVSFEFGDASVGVPEAIGHDLGEEAEEDGVVGLSLGIGEVVEKLGIDLDAVDVVEGAGGGGAGGLFAGVEEGEFADEFAGGIDAGDFFTVLADEEFAFEEDEEGGVFGGFPFLNDDVAGFALDDGSVREDFIETAAADGGEEGDLGEGGGEFAGLVDVGNFSHGC